MASDKTKLGGLSPQLFLDLSVSLARRLMVLHAVRAESPLEEIDNAAVLKLPGLNLQQIVRKREQPEPGLAQLAQCHRNNDVGSKSQEISRAWNEAAALIQSIIKKIGGSSP
jgi:hypothetical protein